MLPIARKLRIGPDAETATREAFPLPMCPERTREPRGYAVDAIAEFFEPKIANCIRVVLRLVRGKINFARRKSRVISTLAATGRFRSGQTGQTVNLLALRLRWFESSPAQFLAVDSAESVPTTSFSGLFAGRHRGDHHRSHLPRHSRVRHLLVGVPLADEPRSQLTGDLQRFDR